MKTVVINLLGAPGSGKTAIASDIFSQMKYEGYDVELVSEYAKELVWEERNETFKNELYIFAKQHQRMFRLNSKVKFIITDRPLILSAFYNSVYGDNSPEFDNIVTHEVNKFDNKYFFLKRDFNYIQKGRNQSEEESDEFSEKMEILLLDRLNIDFDIFKSNRRTAGIILNKIFDEYPLNVPTSGPTEIPRFRNT